MSIDQSVDQVIAEDREQIWAQTREHSERRAVIEQAKGMLMFIYGIDPDDAFAALRSQSQQHNVKLRLIAEQVVKDLVELTRTKGHAPTPGLDGVITAARNRITHVAARQLDGESKTGVPMKEL